MLNSPLISVLLPVYNAEKYLYKAIESIINQSYTNLEIICINDGSEDKSEEIIKQFCEKDKRIVYVKNDKNLGLIKSLNKAIDVSKGKYIARMDADDVSLPNRLEEQLSFITNNAEIQLCDCNIKFQDEDGRNINRSNFIPNTDLSLLFYSFFKTPISHPALFVIAEVLKTNKYVFSDNTLHCEDYDLWIRLLQKGIKVKKIRKKLYIQNVNKQSVSNKFESVQKRNFTQLTKKHVENYFQKLIDIDIWQYSVNRFDDVDFSNLKLGIETILLLRKRFVEKNNILTKSLEYKEIVKITNQQILDIKIQAFKKSKTARSFFELVFSKQFYSEFFYLLKKFVRC